MLTPKQLEQLPDNLVELYAQAEADIIADMVRRITTYDYFIPAVQWQYIKAREMGLLHDEIIKRLSLAIGIAKNQIEEMLKEAGAETLQTDDEIYKSAGLDPKPLSAAPELQQILAAGIEKTQGLFKNLTKTTANTATKQFENMLDRVYMQVTTGAFDYNSAIRMAVKALASKGIATIQYPSGHVDYLEVAVRRATVTGVNQTAAKLQESRADEMESDLVETTAHAGARPTHIPWQGRIFSRSGKSKKYPDFVKSTGYGTGAGLCGWNCRHNFHPFIEGISVPANTEKELEEMNAVKYEYNGKAMTEYEATQKQRYIERQIRRWKREEQAFKAIDFPTDEVTAKVRQWQKVQKDFINQTGLKRQYDREQIGKAVVNTGNGDIIKATGNTIIIGRKAAPMKSKPNSIIDHIGKGAKIKTRSYYNELGLKNKEINPNNHGNPKMHPYGKNGEHVHDIMWDENGKFLDRTTRELTDVERKENSDIL